MGASTIKGAEMRDLEFRDVHDVRGRVGRMLALDGYRCIISHAPDGGADVVLVKPNGDTLREYHFPPHVMDALAEWASGPSRMIDDGADQPEGLSYCGACFNGRCKDCAGKDRCQCDHKGRNALAKEGPPPG